MPSFAVRRRDAPPIEEQATVTLEHWRIFELPDGSRHFCGFHAGGWPHKGRVSTEIVQLDADAMTGMTGSGRVYRLEGPPGEDVETDVVRDAWMLSRGLDPATASYVEPQAAIRGFN